jgi:DNA-binding beta-propeller fold protein YncE
MKKSRRRDQPIKFYSFLGILLLFFLGVGGLGGCGDVTGKKKVSPPVERKGGTLYVVNAGDGSLLAFDSPQNNASNLQSVLPQGNISPSRRFPESITGPAGIFLDRTTDTLYVANSDRNAVLIYENASALNPTLGLAAATRTISGPKTGLNRPFAVVYNPQNKQLYVANTDDYRILIFEEDCPGAPSTLDGDLSPCRIISGASTLLDYPRALALDMGRDLLYVSNMGGNSILAFNNISQPTTRGDVSPSRVITSHTDASRTDSMLQLPFGLFIDSANDRLYAVKAGGNLPAILIYETASLKGDTPAACTSDPSRCGIAPERLLTTPFSELPPECTDASAPPECATTQLTHPAGIEVDVARSRIYVVNNNNTNNVNVTGGRSTDSTALLIFNLKDADNNDRCPTPPQRCNLSPDWRIGGDVTGDNKTTLTNPVGVAVDMERDLIYLSNPPANNILVFSLEGNMAPAKINSGGIPIPALDTKLEYPISFFYDSAIDRLYVANFNSTVLGTPNITVYDNVSSRFFLNTPPSWTMNGPTSDIQLPRAVYLDRTRRLLIILSGIVTAPELQIYNIDAIPNFPLDSASVPAGTAINLPTPTKTFATAQGLHRPKAMAVDEGRGLVYIVQDCDATPQSNCPLPAGSGGQPEGNKIVVYDLNNLNGPAPVRTIGGATTGTGLNRPFGVFIDPTRDILYVTNTGTTGTNPNSILAFHNASTANGSITPDRVISSPGGAAPADILSTPTAPFVNMADDRLFLINRGNNSIYIYDNASGRSGALEPDRKIAGSATSLLFPSGFSGDGTDITGALLVDTSRGKETLFVGQPKDPFSTAQGALLIFSREGNIAPSRVWSGGGASLAGPSAMAVDGETLYVANQGNPNITADDSISVFSTASQIEGNTISPQSVTNGLNHPAGLAVDPVQDQLYVANGGADCSNPATPCNAILVFNTANLGSGSSPQRTLSSPALNAPRGLALDVGRKILYVANSEAQSVLIFKNVDTLSGTVEPDIELIGFENPIAVAIDPDHDLLYVLDEETKEIVVIEAASSESVTVTERVITGDFMTTPSSLFLDPQNDLLYVADQGANMIYIFTGASSAEGEADHTTLAGNITGLNQPVALAAEQDGAP